MVVTDKESRQPTSSCLGRKERRITGVLASNIVPERSTCFVRRLPACFVARMLLGLVPLALLPVVGLAAAVGGAVFGFRSYSTWDEASGVVKSYAVRRCLNVSCMVLRLRGRYPGHNFLRRDCLLFDISLASYLRQTGDGTRSARAIAPLALHTTMFFRSFSSVRFLRP